MTKRLTISFVIIIIAIVTIVSLATMKRELTSAPLEISTTVENGNLCSDEWAGYIENNISTGDGKGHGPDIGSDEWKSVIEFKLGIRGDANIPPRDSQAWCRYIDQRVKQAIIDSNQAKPSFMCDRVNNSSVEDLICNNKELALLDNELAATYTLARNLTTSEQSTLLKVEQRGWIKGRNDCWKSDNKLTCVRNAYLYRNAELQAKYGLVPDRGAFTFNCTTKPNNEVIVRFFQTNPLTLIAKRGDKISLMYLQPSASGSKYQGKNTMFWEHQGEALIILGYNAPEMHCKKSD